MRGLGEFSTVLSRVLHALSSVGCDGRESWTLSSNQSNVISGVAAASAEGALFITVIANHLVHARLGA